MSIEALKSELNGSNIFGNQSYVMKEPFNMAEGLKSMFVDKRGFETVPEVCPTISVDMTGGPISAHIVDYCEQCPITHVDPRIEREYRSDG